MYELFVIFRYYNNFLEGEFILYRHKILPYEVSSQFFYFLKIYIIIQKILSKIMQSTKRKKNY